MIQEVLFVITVCLIYKTIKEFITMINIVGTETKNISNKIIDNLMSNTE